MNKKHLKALTKKIGKKAGQLTGVIGSTASVDRYGDIVNQETWMLDAFKNNPVILWNHNAHFAEPAPAIGKATRVEVKNGVLEFDIEFDMDDPLAALIYNKYVKGILNAFSVGFIPHDRARDDENHTILINNELLELSAVNVPANPEALNQMKTLGFDTYSDFNTYLDEATDEKQSDKAVQKDMKTGKTVDKSEDTEENKPLSDDDAMKIAKSAIEILTHKGIIPTASENEGGDGEEASETNRSSTPENPQLGATPEFVAVVREATKQMQGLLAKYNRQQKSK